LPIVLLSEVDFDRISGIMSIERLRFETGHPLSPDKPVEEEIIQILKDNDANIQILSEGYYDLTPRLHINPIFKHSLTVFENGSAIYRLTPRYENVGINSRYGQEIDKFRPGGNITHLPQDEEIVVVADPLKNCGKIGVFEIIRHTPGPNPKK